MDRRGVVMDLLRLGWAFALAGAAIGLFELYYFSGGYEPRQWLPDCSVGRLTHAAHGVDRRQARADAIRRSGYRHDGSRDWLSPSDLFGLWDVTLGPGRNESLSGLMVIRCPPIRSRFWRRPSWRCGSSAARRQRFGFGRAQQVRAAGARDALGLRAAPVGDLLVVAGQQHVGDRPALPLARLGVLRVLEQARPRSFRSASEAAAPTTPGISRTQASISTMAASSPPEST